MAKLCMRCLATSAPKISLRAYGMLGGSIVLGIGPAILSEAFGLASTSSQPITGTSLIAGLLFVGALLHPEVCPRCGSTKIVPDDSPAATIERLRIVESIEAAEQRTKAAVSGFSDQHRAAGQSNDSHAVSAAASRNPS